MVRLAIAALLVARIALSIPEGAAGGMKLWWPKGHEEMVGSMKLWCPEQLQ